MSEFSDLFAEWGKRADDTPKALTVEPYLGSGSLGAKFGAPVSIPGLPQSATTRLVRGPNGNEITSTATVYAELEHLAHFAVHSRVTLDSGRVTTVAALSAPDVYGLMGFVAVNCE